MKKVPLRKCVATQEQLPKKELVRVVRTNEGEVKIDPSGKMNGRGAYLKKSSEAIAIAQKKKALSRALKVEIEESIFEELRAFIHE